MGDEKLQELLHAVIGELAVGIAPLTVVLVEAAVQIPADDLITVQGHTTALTDQLARVTQQMIVEVSNSADNCFNVSGLGTDSPFSQRETACRVTASFSDS